MEEHFGIVDEEILFIKYVVTIVCIILYYYMIPLSW